MYVVTRGDISRLPVTSRDRVVLMGEDNVEGLEAEEVVVVREGELTRRRLIELLVALSADVDEVYVTCNALSYVPVGEAVATYAWLLDAITVFVEERCCSLLEKVGARCWHLPG